MDRRLVKRILSSWHRGYIEVYLKAEEYQVEKKAGYSIHYSYYPVYGSVCAVIQSAGIRWRQRMEEELIDTSKEFTEACTSIYNHIQSLPEEERRAAIQKIGEVSYVGICRELKVPEGYPPPEVIIGADNNKDFLYLVGLSFLALYSDDGQSEEEK